MVRIDSRLRFPSGLPKDFVRDVRQAFTHHDPAFHKRKRLGFTTFGMRGTISTFQVETDGFSVPRGGTNRVRKLAKEHGLELGWIDNRHVGDDVEWPEPLVSPRSYQAYCQARALAKEQGVVRAPTGSGKTTFALLLAAAMRGRVLVVMNSTPLLKQWKTRAVKELGLSPKEIGELKGSGALRIGPRLTLALQQTLSSKSFPIDKVARMFRGVMIDEVQFSAAKTFLEAIDPFESKYRIGVSADETRKDGKEFLIYDHFGDVIAEIERDALEAEGVIVPVKMRLVPTEFRADWYRDAAPGERDFNRLLEEITNDVERNTLIVDLVRRIVRDGESPAMVFSHRIEHARWLADVGLFARDIRSGLMLGGAENAVRFEEDKRRLAACEIDAAVGTYKAIGVGIDVPAVASGVMATPIGSNAQLLNQVRGRACRPSKGKVDGTLYVVWDRHVFPDAAKKFRSMGVHDVQIEEGGRWVRAK